MTTTTIERAGIRRDPAPLPAALRAAHLEAADIVAGLDLDDAALWRAADGFVADIAAAAYDFAARLTGDPPVPTAAGVPPVVRVRELAAAQRRLVRALDGPLVASGQPLDQAANHIRMLGLGLCSVARSAHC